MMDTEKDCVNYIVQGLERIKNYHEKGKIYCIETYEWKNQTNGYYTPYFPPEYRNSYLIGEVLEPEMSWDLFFLMIKVYERIIGTVPSVNFQLNRKWSVILQREMTGWNSEVQELVIELIGKCTRRGKRPKNVMELMDSEDKTYWILKRFIE